MSEALNNQQEKQALQTIPCVKCEVLLGNAKYENMCSNCFSEGKAEKKDDEQKDGLKSEQSYKEKQSVKEHEEQERFSTPPKKSTQQQDIERFQQLIKAPIKKRNENQDECRTQSEDKRKRKFPRIKINSTRYIKPLYIKRRQTCQSPSEESINLKRTHQKLQENTKTEIARGKCSRCSRKTGFLGIICSHCNQNYCNAHRIPEQHQCKVDFASADKIKRRKQHQRTMTKHKGKISQI